MSPKKKCKKFLHLLHVAVTTGTFKGLSGDVIETSDHYFLTGEVDLQGQVKMYTVKVYSNLRNYTEDYGPEESSVVFDNLTPNTVYTVTVTITIFGGASITSDPATATTLDGGKDRDSFKIVIPYST